MRQVFSKLGASGSDQRSGRCARGAIGIATTALVIALQFTGAGPSSGAKAALSRPQPGEWARHGYDLAEERFSPLALINVNNVANLKLAWSYDLDTNRGQESTPLMVNGRLFTTSAWSKVQAFDAASGKLLWSYDPKVPGAAGVKGCCDVVNRGVAIENGRVFLGTFDGRLIALDERTGKELWVVNTVDQSQMYSITGAPRVVDGKVIIGNGGAEFNVRGYVTAYDMVTGKKAWRFYTVPGKTGIKDGEVSDLILERLAGPTWMGKPDAAGGGGTVWDSMAYDPELDLLYIGVGNGGPWNQNERSPGGGDNLFLASIVALRPSTGDYVWHYQETPGDQWDYTATQQMILADLTIDGRPRKVLMQAPKNGFFYVLDRETGKLISADGYVKQTWTTGVDMATGRPKINPEALYNKTGHVWLSLPGFLGAHSWHPMAYNPKTGLVYIPVNELATPYGVNTKPKEPDATATPADERLTVTPADAVPKGRILAWDPVKRGPAWSVELKGPGNGGILATAGGLLFQGTAAGELAAYNSANGRKLWSFPAQSGILAPPITYSIRGKQYVTVVAGWGGAYPLLFGEAARTVNRIPNRSRVLTFELSGKARLPAPEKVAVSDAPPPKSFGTTEQIALGGRLYGGTCARCHGLMARTGGVLPDLQRTPIAQDAEAWQSVVIGGVLESRGMVSFRSELRPSDAEAIRAYVVERANQDRKTR